MSPPGRPPKYSEAQKAEALRLALARTYTDVAQRMDIPVPTVSRWAREAGIIRRPRKPKAEQ